MLFAVCSIKRAMRPPGFRLSHGQRGGAAFFFEGEVKEGRYSIVWGATNDHGMRVASGVYLKAGDFIAQRKNAIVTNCAMAF